MPRTTAARKTAITKPSRFTLIMREPGDASAPAVVRDLQTGLEWTHTLGEATFKNAQKLIDEANAEKLGGYADWRLPTVEELFCLADRTKSSPAIDAEAFPDTKSDWYWSSTPYAPISGCAWFVSFGNGGSNGVRRVSGYFVRAVRASQ